ncbi:MAG TPA: hypothetical protein VEX35_01520 [Allosphingosinicella sp.]|nr:hypothetical protein [Allosphingosinicella sp.]
MRRGRALLLLVAVAALAACARQIPAAVAAGAPGILRGLWDGFVFPWAWIVSLFVPEVSVYAVPNNGGWYDFGYFLGIVVFGVGARRTRIVYRTARTRRRAGVVDAKVIRDEAE